MAVSSTLARRSRRLPPVRWCPTCRNLQCDAAICTRCDDDNARAMTLVRGLTSIDIAEEFGLIRYRGERIREKAGKAGK